MDTTQGGPRKRYRSTTPPWERHAKDSRTNHAQRSPRPTNGSYRQQSRGGMGKQQVLQNQMQEDEQMRKWVAQEDDFVLDQSKKKAKIRVKEGRARVVDWLAVTLSATNPAGAFIDDEVEPDDMEVVDPAAYVESLDLAEIDDLLKDIDTYLSLEKSWDNKKYWSALKTICRHHKSKTVMPGGRQANAPSISSEIDKLLRPKSLKDLEALGNQVKGKLQSDEPIDVEYWENLMESVNVFKAKGELSAVYQSIVREKARGYQKYQKDEALELSSRLRSFLTQGNHFALATAGDVAQGSAVAVDPESDLRLRPEDKTLKLMEEQDFVDRFDDDKRRIRDLGYIPAKRGLFARKAVGPDTATGLVRPQVAAKDDLSSTTNALYEREVARGVQDDEEIFAGEEEVATSVNPQWAGKYRPRKPKYFNRVQMGYEWNKYNQTHYDHDNPPPKVVQGYKFNIFYPDLIDKTKAPTYRIEREGGRKRGEVFAPAGEEDTCLIRFVSGPPYEDIAFRMVDKEWDFSAKRERGFRSSFDKGILQLHFQFKKVYYRK